MPLAALSGCETQPIFFLFRCLLTYFFFYLIAYSKIGSRNQNLGDYTDSNSFSKGDEWPSVMLGIQKLSTHRKKG